MTKTLKYNEGWNIGWAAFLRAKTYFFVREHCLKLWIIIKDNQSANFVLNKGLKFEIVKDISRTSVSASCYN